MSKTDALDLVWQDLTEQVAQIKKQMEIMGRLSERAETSGGHPAAATLALAPTVAGGASGLKAGDSLWIGNARKSGEGVGAGTGLIAYYNPSTDSWYRPSDDTAVVI